MSSFGFDALASTLAVLVLRIFLLPRLPYSEASESLSDARKPKASLNLSLSSEWIDAEAIEPPVDRLVAGILSVVYHKALNVKGLKTEDKSVQNVAR